MSGEVRSYPFECFEPNRLEYLPDVLPDDFSRSSLEQPMDRLLYTLIGVFRLICFTLLLYGWEQEGKLLSRQRSNLYAASSHYNKVEMPEHRNPKRRKIEQNPFIDAEASVGNDNEEEEGSECSGLSPGKILDFIVDGAIDIDEDDLLSADQTTSTGASRLTPATVDPAIEEQYSAFLGRALARGAKQSPRRGIHEGVADVLLGRRPSSDMLTWSRRKRLLARAKLCSIRPWQLQKKEKIPFKIHTAKTHTAATISRKRATVKKEFYWFQVLPMLREFDTFSPCEALDPEFLLKTKYLMGRNSIARGDRVKCIAGELQNLIGVVLECEEDTVNVHFESLDIDYIVMRYEVRKYITKIARLMYSRTKSGMVK
ncbi:hypothetical protein CPC08DRAFT_727874 [Agrocybe pediades]|nr:hypothetical protein CPC08DRAFT_727874 [Agrocybe pediades]